MGPKNWTGEVVYLRSYNSMATEEKYGTNTTISSFQKKVPLEPLKENLTLQELAQKYDIHPIQVSAWKKELIEGAEK